MSKTLSKRSASRCAYVFAVTGLAVFLIGLAFWRRPPIVYDVRTSVAYQQNAANQNTASAVALSNFERELRSAERVAAAAQTLGLLEHGVMSNKVKMISSHLKVEATPNANSPVTVFNVGVETTDPRTATELIQSTVDSLIDEFGSPQVTSLDDAEAAERRVAMAREAVRQTQQSLEQYLLQKIEKERTATTNDGLQQFDPSPTDDGHPLAGQPVNSESNGIEASNADSDNWQRDADGSVVNSYADNDPTGQGTDAIPKFQGGSTTEIDTDASAEDATDKTNPIGSLPQDVRQPDQPTTKQVTLQTDATDAAVETSAGPTDEGNPESADSADTTVSNAADSDSTKVADEDDRDPESTAAADAVESTPAADPTLNPTTGNPTTGNPTTGPTAQDRKLQVESDSHKGGSNDECDAIAPAIEASPYYEMYDEENCEDFDLSLGSPVREPIQARVASASYESDGEFTAHSYPAPNGFDPDGFGYQNQDLSDDEGYEVLRAENLRAQQELAAAVESEREILSSALTAPPKVWVADSAAVKRQTGTTVDASQLCSLLGASLLVGLSLGIVHNPGALKVLTTSGEVARVTQLPIVGILGRRRVPLAAGQKNREYAVRIVVLAAELTVVLMLCLMCFFAIKEESFAKRVTNNPLAAYTEAVGRIVDVGNEVQNR